MSNDEQQRQIALDFAIKFHTGTEVTVTKLMATAKQMHKFLSDEPK
jgi:hypothetical protein